MTDEAQKQSEAALLQSKSPILFFTVSLIITMIIFIGMAFHIFSSYKAVEAFKTKDLRVEELRGIIVHLDEVLTMSARMAASTGDASWEDRYTIYAPQLDNAIKEAIQLSGNSYGGDAAAQTDQANSNLIEMETEAFKHVKDGLSPKAMELLFSRRYEEQKKIYAQGMGELTRTLHDEVRRHVDYLKNVSWIVITVLVIILPFLILSWGLVIRILHRWRTALLRSHESLAGKNKEMQALNADLDRKIEERTGELREMRDEAIKASRAKTEFLAAMSHEIRTPMNAIIGMTELLLESKLDDEQREYIRTLQRNGDNLLNIINDILDLSKVEAGKMDLEETEFDFRQTVEHVTELMALKSHQKGLELIHHIEPTIPNKLVGDPHRLRQVLVNLLGNALKFTDKGEIALDVNRSATQTEGHSFMVLRFSVRDTGIGIPKEKAGTLFSAFTQVDSSTTRKYGGTGLGLAISKKLVEVMGGQIWLESEPGKGTTFFFTLRLKLCGGSQEEEKAPKAPPVFDRLRVLIVDDNATNRWVLREMMKGWGAAVKEAEGGLEGMDEIIRMKENDELFDLILLDCRMPGMDGFEFVERVRKDLSLKDITIMMLTSDNRQGDIARAKAVGLSGYLVKPVKKAELFEAISKALGRSGSKKTEDEAELTQTERKALRILLVEDNIDNRDLVKFYLKSTPYQLEIALDGEEACKKCREKSYDLVLMDLHMPVMDGYAATREIRRWEKEQEAAGKKKGGRLLILALSANALQEEIKKSYEAGCDEHLTKPIKKAALLETLEKYERLKIKNNKP
jgi:two-component system sensor histidine kinase/response regulator